MARPKFAAKVPLSVDRFPNPTTCLIPGPVHIFGVRTQGAMTHKFELGDILVQCTYPQDSSSLFYFISATANKRNSDSDSDPMFTRSAVIVLTNTQTNKQTNKQTDAAENIQRSSLRYVVG